ncbi:C-type lectin domain family 10 member A-like [Synchiropus picturatus]
MTTEYHDDAEDDSNSFWSKDQRPVSISGAPVSRRWLFPGLAAAFTLLLLIIIGAIGGSTTNRLWTVENKVSNLTEVLITAQKLAQDASKDVQRLKFSVENNKDQLGSVSEALKQLSTLDSISRSVNKLKCSLERLTNNGTAGDTCCPAGWENFETSCYYFASNSLSWDKARDWCNGHDSHLVILQTEEEWRFVISRASGLFHWIGLTDERTGKWEWVNLTPYIMNRSRWMPGQPDAWTNHGLGPGDEDCAHIHYDGRLNDLHCSQKLRYICQKHGMRS